MTLGILVYVDDVPAIIEEFNWLYKSILFSGLRGYCQIIAVCHPDAEMQLPKDDIIIPIPQAPFSEQFPEWGQYKYINSVGNLCSEAAINVARDFDYILKTDCDTFVTRHLRDFRPTNVCFGIGAYAYDSDVRRHLVRWAEQLGFPHSGIHNVGASLLGTSPKVMQFLHRQLTYCERLLREEFSSSPGAWPGWFGGVLTMYAGELSLRSLYPQAFSLGLLDHFCHADRQIGSDVLHIHAWHTEQYFSKRKYRAGEYDHIPLDSIDRSSLAGYCHYLAAVEISGVS
jgi:hypothetical protein